MILSDRDIRYWMNKGEIGLQGYEDLEDQIQPASIDLHLGVGMIEYAKNSQLYPNWSNHIANTHYNKGEKCTITDLLDDAYDVYPGRFYLGTTQERIKLGNNIGARIEGKSSLGRKGLVVHCTAGWIDPGFEGEITLEIFSVMPCIQVLKPGDKIAQICFFKLSSEVERPYGPERGSKYQNQRGPTRSRG
jgi:dCTP deaminase